MNLGRRLGRVGVFGQAVVFVLFVRNLSAGLLERELTRLEAALRFPRGESQRALATCPASPLCSADPISANEHSPIQIQIVAISPNGAILVMSNIPSHKTNTARVS
jgi:hypothetical protein